MRLRRVVVEYKSYASTACVGLLVLLLLQFISYYISHES